jgi:hypothetical protein
MSLLVAVITLILFKFSVLPAVPIFVKLIAIIGLVLNSLSLMRYCYAIAVTV